MMERDEGKYVMYFAAMEAAIRDVHAARTEAERATPMVCIVAGAGFGRYELVRPSSREAVYEPML